MTAASACCFANACGDGGNGTLSAGNPHAGLDFFGSLQYTYSDGTFVPNLIVGRSTMDLIKQKAYFDSPEFQAEFHCDAQLGAVCSDRGTQFSLWAPTAQAVVLHLYETGNDTPALETVHMQRHRKGLWTFTTKKNLDGRYYEYEVVVDGVRRKTADPYARACGINGTRSMVLDLRRTDPEGWQEDCAPAQPAQNVIYEVHVKDFSWDPDSGVPQAHRGKYTAFCLTDTVHRTDASVPTCVNHLKQLGVTHVQLMPVYDYGSVDEAGDPEAFNWGYDPVNYNIPEGSYSSDPHHGEVRIRELKQAIQSLHRQGIRVIMDVVYNHTYKLESWLWKTVPWYYYRQKPDGTESNGSGCGSELASERSMCAKYIVDSVLYWAEEYHMDGFRFDLMGMLDTDLMNTIRRELDDRYGPGEKLLYGEPWAGGTCHPRPGTTLCSGGNLRLVPGVGAFSDRTRDAVKGSLMDPGARGFVNGGGLHKDHLTACLCGWAGARGPAENISYLSCHDDWTLWDKLVYTIDPEKNFTGLSPDVLRANRLAAAINFCCQGQLFLLSGEEFGRTKSGIRNTYQTELAINRMDWNRAKDNRLLVQYYRGLLHLRQLLPGLCDKTTTASGRILWTAQPADDCAAVMVDNTGGQWEQVLLVFNGSRQPQTLNLPEGTWQVLADGENSLRWQTPLDAGKRVTVSAVSAQILGLVKQEQTGTAVPVEA